MSNRSGNARSLIALTPIREGVTEAGESYAYRLRRLLQTLPLHTQSPFARVPDTYLARWFLLDDVRYQGGPAKEDHLENRYLALLVQFYGPTDRWLRNLWQQAHSTLEQLYCHAWGFADVRTAEDWQRYLERCRVPTGYFFNGSNDDPLLAQLKALYLRQMLTHFAIEHQGASDEALHQAFLQWVQKHEPANLTAPTWQPGAATLAEALRFQREQGESDDKD
ncbi:MAG: hypothetical protein LAT62_09230 [Natronospirillum sp.]|uniref:hypothetical protein n=1 Tax=Natronospirillum sp. TaxID=2812955 RepID=UPI0025F96F65|nr:hypothetical protein [Natronospirillum sp.]MCH8552106.1 hypothetical protein [Natronospirillum sp.]